MKRLLPKVADNNFLGQKSAYYFFIFFMVVNTVRSFIHLLAEDAGLNSIANIIVFEGTPDPNKVIYLTVLVLEIIIHLKIIQAIINFL